MQKTTGTLLVALMLLLVASFMIAIFGAAARESQLEPGAAASAPLRRRGRIAMAVTAVALVAILFLGEHVVECRSERTGQPDDVQSASG